MKFSIGLLVVIFCSTTCSERVKSDSCPRLESIFDKSVRIKYFGDIEKLPLDTLGFLDCDEGFDIFPEHFSSAKAYFYLTCEKPGPDWKPPIVENPKCLQRCDISMIDGNNFQQIVLDEKDTTAATQIKHGQNIEVSCEKGHDLYTEDSGFLSKLNSKTAVIECIDGSWNNKTYCLPEMLTYNIGIELYAEDGSLPDDVYISFSNGENSTEKQYLCGDFKKGIFNLNYISTVPLSPACDINATIEIKIDKQNEQIWKLEKLSLVSSNLYTIIPDRLDSHCETSGIQNITCTMKIEALETKYENESSITYYTRSFNSYLKDFDKWKRCFDMNLPVLNNSQYPKFLFQTCCKSATSRSYFMPNQTLKLKPCQHARKNITEETTSFFSYVTTHVNKDAELLQSNTSYTIKIETENESTDKNVGEGKLYFIIMDELNSTEKMYFTGYDILGSQLKHFVNQRILENVTNITIGIEGEESERKYLFLKYLSVTLRVGGFDRVYAYYDKFPIQVPSGGNITLPLKERGCTFPESAPRVVKSMQKQVYLPGDSFLVSDFECEPNTVLSSREEMKCLTDGTWSVNITCVSDLNSMINIWKHEFQLWASAFSAWKK